MTPTLLRPVLRMAAAAIRFELARCAILNRLPDGPGDEAFHAAVDRAGRADAEFQAAVRAIPGALWDVLTALDDAGKEVP